MQKDHNFVTNKIKAAIFSVSVGTFFAFFCFIQFSQAAGNTYYVSTSGNDVANNGLSSGAPWKTVSKVNNFNFQPGDTVLFNKGNTWGEQLIPKSGTGESTRITYGAYGSGNKPVIDNANLANKSYVTIDSLKFESAATTAINLSATTHCIISNSEIYTKPTNGNPWSALDIRNNSNYNKFLDNTVARLATSNQGDSIALFSSNYNLISGNTFGVASHYTLSLYSSSYNVVKNNIVNNALGSNMGVVISGGPSPDHNVIEDNTVFGGGKNPYNAGSVAIQWNGGNNIVRRNIFRDNSAPRAKAFAGGGWNSSVNTGNRFYNNLATNYSDAGAWGITMDAVAPDYISDIVLKNNIFSNNGNSEQIWVWENSSLSDYHFNNNIIYKAGKTSMIRISNSYYWSVAEAQTNRPASYTGNLQSDPLLDSTYHPTASSPAIDSGSFLTTVTSPSGTGSSLVVSDAKYFFDGYGIVSGDTIQVGTQLATITSINYTTNTLTLNKSISWTQNQGISLPYNGSKPDIGVYEYGGVATTPTPTPTPTFSKCDQNHDTSINVLDLQSLANVILGKTVCTYTCDLNQDGSVNVLDLQYLANVILGKSSCQ